VPSSAIEKGLTAQLMNRVTPTPLQCCRTDPKAPKSIFSNIGTIISQISTATTRLTWATSAEAMAPNRPGSIWPNAMPVTMQSATHRLR
jgi:hypothetical protein